MKDQSVNKKHHWLFAAQLVFLMLDKNGNPKDDGAAITLNGLVLTENQEVRQADLARAQMQAVANLNERFKDQSVQVVDCVFLNFNYLGHMSREVYSAKPEGQALVKTEVAIPEKPKAEVVPFKKKGE